MSEWFNWPAVLARLRRQGPPAIPDGLWHDTLAAYPFLALDEPKALSRLRQLAAGFLARKEFHGAQGLVITDTMATAVAAQACLPLVHLPGDPLAWYQDFVGIVIHPDTVLARRQATDEAGVVHAYAEELAGEAMDGGPVMLNWKDVSSAAEAAITHGTNLVIHEFAHKLDMQDGAADGCPPLPWGFAGTATATAAKRHWLEVLHAAYASFHDAVVRHERFGEAAPWLDAYGAEAPAEFFAVACEAYFVNRTRFATEFPQLLSLFDAFFRQPGQQGPAS